MDDIAQKKAALREYLDKKVELDYWTQKVADIEQESSYHSPSFSVTSSHSGSPGNPTERYIVALEAARDRMRRAEEEAEAAMNRVISIIQTLPNVKHRLVLMRRYIDGMTWDDIADAEFKSRTWAINIHGMALKNIQL